jgi:uncharacterized membrane protein YhaH (DUF805 family)
MADLKDKYGNLVYRIEGDRINDTYGNWLYEIRGDDIFDTHGNRLYQIRGDDLYDTYGTRIGEMSDFANIVPLNKSSNNTTTYRRSSSSGSSDSEGGGFSFWAILALLLFAFWHFLKGPFVAFSLLKEPAARKEWWGTNARSIFLTLLFAGIIGSMVQGTAGETIVGIIVLAFGLIPIIVVCIRRMHDIGKSGWWSLIPFVGFVMGGFFRGKTEDNKYI